MKIIVGEIGWVALLLAQRVTFVAAGLAVEQLPPAAGGGIDRMGLACNVVIERRIEGDLRSFVRRDGPYQVRAVGLRSEGALKISAVPGDRCDPRDGGIEIRLAHLDRIDDRQRRLLLETRGSAIPELRRVVERVQNRGRIALTRAALDAGGNRLAVRECARRIVAGAAGDRAVRGQASVEKQTLAECDLLGRLRVVRRDRGMSCGCRQSKLSRWLGLRERAGRASDFAAANRRGRAQCDQHQTAESECALDTPVTG